MSLPLPLAGMSAALGMVVFPTAFYNHDQLSGERERDKAGEGKAHSDGEGERLRMSIRVKPDERLENRSRQLIGERDKANVNKVQMQRAF